MKKSVKSDESATPQATELRRRADKNSRSLKQKAQEELDDSRASYFDLFNLAPMGYLTLNEKGLILKANLTAATLLGVLQSEVVNQPITRFILKDDQNIYHLHRKKIFEAGNPLACELRMVKKGRAPFWVHLESSIVQDKGGASLCLLVLNDITERKKAEEELGLINSILSTQQETSIDGILVVDENGKIISSNSRFVNLWSISSEIMESKSDERALQAVMDKLVDPDEFISKVKHLYETRDETSRDEIALKDGRTLDRYSAPMFGTDRRYYGRVWYFCDITERKRAEDALRESEEKYRLLLENANEAVSVQRYGTFLYANRVCGEVLGVPVSELLGSSMMEFINPDDREKATSQHLSILRGELASGRTDFRVLTRNGEERWADVNSVGIIWNGKKATLNFATDITERKRAEEALRESEEKYRSLVENINDVFYTLDGQGNITYISPVVERVTRYKVSDLIGRPFMPLIYPDDLPGLLDSFNRLVSGQLEPWEYRVQDKDGRLIFVRSSSHPVYKDGEIVGFTSLMTDITERKRVEDAVRESEELFRSYLENAPDGIYMSDLEGTFLYGNRRCEEIIGYKREELIGKNFLEFNLLSEKSINLAVKLLQSNIEGKSTGPDEIELINKEGRIIPVEINTSVVQRMGQRITLAFVRDITERKQAEAELLKTNRQLEEAMKKSEIANIAKSEFLANMSHEIRTPMNGVIGMTGLLLDTELTEEQRRYAETVRASGETLLGLINDVLDFSKMEANKLDLEMLEFDLSSLLDDFAATLAVLAHEKRLELICAADPAVPTLLWGDPGRLRQILTNMVGNAIKFTQTGEVAVRVLLVEENENDVLLRFSVHDTGIGIPADKLELLFDKFSQVDASTTRRYGGTGLGLAIAKQLAELMGGEIGVKSTVGQGTEFWFTARLGRQTLGTQAESIPPADLYDIRALIVDDNATNRDILTSRMVSWGMRPSEAESGPEALKALYQALNEKDPFKIAVIDMQMPGMNGESLGFAIQTDPRLADIRMVMLTSLGLRGDAQRFAKIGFAAYATKPIRHHELKTVLSLALTEPTPQPFVTRHTARETLNQFLGRKVLILLAEDNITNQQVALGILKKLGLRANAVANGAEALKALMTIPYDLVLMDVQMPVMDGLEAAREIRSPQSAVFNHGIPIIAMTAHALQGDKEKCLEAGMDDYITKPVSPQSLAEVLRKWLPKEEENEGKE